MKKQPNHISIKLLPGLLLLFCISCQDLTDHEKFRRPDWLPGKLYTTVAAQENLSMFAECLVLTGLDTILNVSGAWSVFAPTNEAMEQYLMENQYSGFSDILPEELRRIIKFHIIQNPWTSEQLQSLGAYGWRTADDGNSFSYAFKRQTILKNPDEKYWIKRKNRKEMIVIDSIVSDGYKRVFVESRKYVPIFYDEFMEVNGLTSDDYNFYFNRIYERGNGYYAGARILEADIFAENGFVHIIDKVVTPLLNAKEILERELPGETYKLFLEMVYWYYPSFEYNLAATNNQPAIRRGGDADTLWDLNYSDLPFVLHRERTGYEGNNANETQVIHNGMFIPTDNAFREFVDGTLTAKSGLPHWSDFKALPADIISILLPRHFRGNAIYPSSNSYRDIFFAEGRFRQNEGDIIRKEFGSNCTFIGLDAYIPDKVFTSVTGPVFLRPAYSSFRLALQYTGLHDLLANHGGDLCFFPISDYALGTDTTMVLNWTNRENNVYNFVEYNRDMRVMEVLDRNTIRSRILNHVGTSLPDGSANKEFIRTLGDNYIIWNNSDNTVRGSLPSTLGFNGKILRTCYPALMDGPSSNGRSYSVDYWFNNSNNSLQTVLWRYTKFFSLLTKAELFNQGSYNLSFIDNSKNYTVFVPSDEALTDFQADTLSIDDLKKFLKHHFLSGSIIFTDNKKPSGEYATASGTILDIRTDPDMIEILDSAGNTYISIPEQENSTNIMVSVSSKVTSVVHEIDKVLIPW